MTRGETTARQRAIAGAERRVVELDGVARQYTVIPDYQISLAPGEPWHRRGAFMDRTACGILIPKRTGATRGYILDRKICIPCHTLDELHLAYGHTVRAGINPEYARIDVSERDLARIQNEIDRLNQQKAEFLAALDKPDPEKKP